MEYGEASKTRLVSMDLIGKIVGVVGGDGQIRAPPYTLGTPINITAVFFGVRGGFSSFNFLLRDYIEGSLFRRVC